MAELSELVGFLGSPLPVIRQVAVENLIPFSLGRHSYIFKRDDYLPVRHLKAITNDNRHRSVKYALTILINLCDDQAVLEFLADDAKFVESIGNHICDLREVNTDLFAILLANLAKNDSVTHIFDMKRTKPVQRQPEAESPDNNVKDIQADSREDIEKKNQLALDPIDDSKIFLSDMLMDCLIDCFVKGADRSLNRYAEFDYLSYFFSDISRFKNGRDYFVKQQAYDEVIPVTKLLVFTSHESKVRRVGVAATLKNCLFDLDTHETLVKDPEINLLSYMLLPLAAGEDEYRDDEMFELPDDLQMLPEDKKRESDVNVLATLVECLLLLCTTRPIREYLRDQHIYPVIRELHSHVEDDAVREPSERLVQMLMGDESQEKIKELDDDEDDEDEGVVEVV